MEVKQHYAVIFVIIAMVVGFAVGIMSANNQTTFCKEAVVKERIITTVNTDKKNVTKEVTQYLIECRNNNSTFRIQTDRDYPLNSNIKKTWVRDGK